MNRHHKRKSVTTLNMVSLMDIFTILVFFLLVTATDQDSLPSMKDIKLPEAHAEKNPKQNLVIMVSQKNILLQGKKVVSAQSAIRGRNAVIPELASELQKVADAKVSKRLDKKKIKKRGVTIMGDQKIPYVLLKKIMLTCASIEFTNISLAITQKLNEQDE